MTTAEVQAFVEREIASRYRSLDDTVRGDWVRALWKCGDLGTAQDIIRVLVDDPDASLNIKQFYRQLQIRRRPAAATTHEIPAYDPWIRCLAAPADHPTWQDREWFVMGFPANNRMECFRRANHADKRYVADWAGRAAKEYSAVHGGQWCGVVREVDNSPYEGDMTPAQRLAEAKRRILDGPDTPGRRFLQSLPKGGRLLPTLKDVPKIDPPRTVASRAMIDRLAAPLPLGGGPQPFDPDHDPELQDDLPF